MSALGALRVAAGLADELLDPRPRAGLLLPQRPPALRGLDLRVEHGERVAVLGPNGAGKTTFMLHLNGLLMGDGRLEVAGLEVERPALQALRARVGLVFQDPDDQLFMPTVAEDVAFGPLNLGLGRDETRERVAEALAAVRMSGAESRAPHELSMGERRRVAIATVLAMRPSLLVLDEPSANLDPRGRRELLEVLADVDRTICYHARPALRGGAVPAGGDPRRRARGGRRDVPEVLGTRTCWPRTTWSCRRASCSRRCWTGARRTQQADGGIRTPDPRFTSPAPSSRPRSATRMRPRTRGA